MNQFDFIYKDMVYHAIELDNCYEVSINDDKWRVDKNTFQKRLFRNVYSIIWTSRIDGKKGV